MSVAESRPPVRAGCGWDIHRLVAGRPLRLGGVTIPWPSGLLGHSDGDVVLHALCDALLGAVGAGDIGTHFPDTDAAYEGIDSAILVERVVLLVRQRGHQVGNVDVTILAEQPRLGPVLPLMRGRLAALLEIDAERVSLKAKTMEGLGAIGRGEAIAASVVAIVVAT